MAPTVGARSNSGARCRVGAIYGAGWGESRILADGGPRSACLAAADPLVSPRCFEAAPAHALDSLLYSPRSRPLHLAADRGGGAVVAGRIQCRQFAEPVRRDARRFHLPGDRA